MRNARRPTAISKYRSFGGLAKPARAAHIGGMIDVKIAKFAIGQVVRHRLFSFRGLIYDIDPEFANTEEWWLSIPEAIRPHKNQPFYHLYAENDETTYEAYVSEQNLLPDDDEAPLRHPDISDLFESNGTGGYRLRSRPY
jgi:heat shock protein HspQ